MKQLKELKERLSLDSNIFPLKRVPSNSPNTMKWIPSFIFIYLFIYIAI